MMRYEAQVIVILPPIPATPRQFYDERVPVNAVHSVRSLGYEVRAPSLEKGNREILMIQKESNYA